MGSQFDNTFNQIIIIGNGFDLACGLHSSYDDFFEFIFNNEDYSDFDYVNLSKKFNNIWELIFIYAKQHPITTSGLNFYFQWHDVDNVFRSSADDDTKLQEAANTLSRYTNAACPWQDVENIIQRCVSSTDEHFAECNPETIYFAMKFPEKYSDDSISLAIAQLLTTRYRFDLDNIASDAKSLDLQQGNGVKSSYWTREENLIALAYLIELHEFEKIFVKYLNNQITQLPKYLQNARNLYFNISNYSDMETGSTDKKDCILSFNYTTPLLEIIKQDDDDKELENRLWVQKNVHGTLTTPVTDLESPIIFGIDGFDADGKRNPKVNQIFSKSYRQLNLEKQWLPDNMNNPRRTIIDPIHFNTKINCIKIYGHSLGEADYSYFKTIFDSVNLVNGNTVLYILYAKGHKPDSMAIYRLLDRYSDEVYRNRMTGSATRIDILQKLLVEDRIRLREIANPFTECTTTSQQGEWAERKVASLEKVLNRYRSAVSCWQAGRS